MPRTRVPPSERLAQLERALQEKEPLLTIRRHPAWPHFLSLFDAMLDVSETRFRLGQIGAKEHRANLNSVEATRALVEDSETQLPKLIEEIGTLEEHLKRQRERRPPTLPGS